MKIISFSTSKSW